MADEDELVVDVEGEFNVKLGSDCDLAFDTNEPPSRTVHLQPEFTHHPWVLEQGWSLDHCIDEKSKAAIEKMLMEEQLYMNGLHPPNKGKVKVSPQPPAARRTWTDREKEMFRKGMEIHGRSWTKISELISTRTPLQVKNYAQQFFKQQAKLGAGPLTQAVSNQPCNSIKSALLAVTTAQPTVNIPNSVYAKYLLQKKVHVKDVGRNSPKKKCSPSSVQIATEERNCGLEISHTASASASVVPLSEPKSIPSGKEALLKLIENDPTVKRIEKVDDDEDIDVDVEFDEDDSGPASSNTGQESTSEDISSTEGVSGTEAAILPEEDSDTPCVPIESLASPVWKDKEIKTLELVVDLATSGGCFSMSSVRNITEPSEENLGVAVGMAKSPHSPQVDTEKFLYHDEQEDCEMNLGKEGLVADLTNHSSDICNPRTLMEFNQNQSSDELELAVDQDQGKSVESEKNLDQNNGSDNGNDSSNHDGSLNGGYVLTSNGDSIFLPPPEQAVIIDRNNISDQEKTIHSEFFLGRLLKTPDRYLKIRNYILDAWDKSKPEYLNKTSIRPGLKNCGDVNSIGRVHAYLEQIGAINFGCEQTNYFKKIRVAQPPVKKEKIPESRGRRLNLLSRKRRVPVAYGESSDEPDFGGRTIHETDLHGGENKFDAEKQHTPVPRSRVPKQRKDAYWYDPFKLIQCGNFTENEPAPFILELACSAMAVMDLHAHTSKTEVIGLLGGQYSKDGDTLEVLTAEPCNSLSTGMQCEMDPVSQTYGMERITDQGLNVVGWYHSHPTFAPNPSVRDVETQEILQNWFSKGGLPFIGVIVNPYNRVIQSPNSKFNCIIVRKEKHPGAQCNAPFQLQHKVTPCVIPLGQFLLKLRDLVVKSSRRLHRVEMLRLYKKTCDLSCLEKMLISMKSYLNDNMDGIEKFCSVLRDLVVEHFQEDDTSL